MSSPDPPRAQTPEAGPPKDIGRQNGVKQQNGVKSCLNTSPRPYSNSICASLLKPEPTNRAHMHRSSDGQLLNDQFRLSPRRESHRPSFQDEYYYNSKRQTNSIFATVWASYLFVFISVLITFSIVFAVGYLLNSMAPREKLNLNERNSTQNENYGEGRDVFWINSKKNDKVVMFNDLLDVISNNNHK